MIVDKNYCMSSFLMYRAIIDDRMTFSARTSHKRLNYALPENRIPICDSDELYDFLKNYIENITVDGKTALALSGGIDSAILAKFMPKGSTAYTFKCIVPGIEVTDESITAAKYAEECELEHKIIEIYWEDFEEYAPLLMKNKGCPIHSIEVQIYKAAMQAKKAGFEKFIFGEAADCVYGGHSQLLSRNWLFGEFINRWAFVMPHMALKNPILDLLPYKEYEKNGYIDVPEFLSYFEIKPSLGFYKNACSMADIELIVPYANTFMSEKLNLERVRNGENKYLVREVFKRLYPDFEVPPKTPMPRPMNEWLKDWKGPTRPEFYPHCTDNMTGDQKWLVWALERFLDIIDE